MIRNEHSHPKLYPVRREENNIDHDFGYDLDISEKFPEQIKKRAKPEKNMKDSNCESSDYAAPTPPLLRKLIFRPFETIRSVSTQKNESISL